MVPNTSVRALRVMIPVTYLPVCVTSLFQGMPGVWKSRHRLLLGWLLVMHALFPGSTTLAELARLTSQDVTAWRWRWRLPATYWEVHRLGAWGAQQALNTLPPPDEGVLTLSGDSRHKPKRGQRHPLALPGRTRAHDPWFFGSRCALLIGSWAGLRLPVACRLMRPTTQPQSRTDNALVRELVRGFTPPSWATAVRVEGAAA